MRPIHVVPVIVLVIVALTQVTDHAQNSRTNISAPSTGACESLTGRSVGSGMITSSQFIAAGLFFPPGSTAPRTGSRLTMPAHCRVTAVLKPSSDSQIEVALWLPTETWNGRIAALGNGAWAGGIDFFSLLAKLQDGYVAAATDTGHKSTPPDASWAIGHPERLQDFGARAVHEMSVAAKSTVEAFYHQRPQYSYWDGCSTGGRQGLVAAQQFPGDFDGIVAGAPVLDQPLMRGGDLAVLIPVLQDASRALNQAKLAALNTAAVAACDSQDGLRDGIISDPAACKFDPATIVCRGAESDSCLTPAQLETVTKVYAPVASKNGRLVSPGKWPGSELSWTLGGLAAPPSAWTTAFQISHDSLEWDWRTFNFDRDVALAEERVGALMNATDPDLSAFKARGGKLLLYHGVSDGSISPANTLNYYRSVLKKMGGEQQDWLRLFLVPGTQHCGGGPGPDQVNYLAAVERWREVRTPPDQLIAIRVPNGTNRVDLMTRPICAFPKMPQYNGVGSPNDAGSFTCQVP
jgi:feruloyl esterase